MIEVAGQLAGFHGSVLGDVHLSSLGVEIGYK